MTRIRAVEDADVSAVLSYISAHVRRSVYRAVLPDPSTHDEELMIAARRRGVALVVDDPDGIVMGTLIMPIYDYMGSAIAEEVAWFADDARDLLRLFAAGEREAVQKGATVLKMSAPASTDLGAFYARRGYEPLESVFVKVLGHGMGCNRDHGGRTARRRPRRLREEEERQNEG